MTDLLWILHKYGLLLLVGSFPRGPLGGLAMTLLLSSLSLLLAFPFSLALALARSSQRKYLYRAATAWVYLVRGIPLIMLIFWVYFLVPLLVGHNISGFATMLATLVIYESAYISEIIRAGMRALPRGQQEAAAALGLGYLQTQAWVILPQAIYNSVPSLVNQLVSIIKETSLGYVINVQELTFAANQINGQVLTRPMDIYLILAMTYFLLCFGLTRLAAALENRVRHRRECSAPSSGELVPAGPAR